MIRRPVNSTSAAMSFTTTCNEAQPPTAPTVPVWPSSAAPLVVVNTRFHVTGAAQLPLSVVPSVNCQFCPSASWNLPAAHGLQVALLVDAATLPGRQGVGSTEPTGQLVPAGQRTHSAIEVITGSDAFVTVPAGHGSAAEAPSAQ